jgi:4-amino-4-deoxy-L-arabinose transferase-like glycosyltransferase
MSLFDGEIVLGLPRRTMAILAAILVLFALGATAYTLTYGKTFKAPSGDGIAYERSAVQLLQKGFYGYKSKVPNAYMSPGYPLFLAAIYGASGHTWSGRPRYLLDAIQILIACTTIIAVFLIGRRLFGDWVGLVAAALVALYPPTTIATNLWLTETISTALVAWFTYIVLIAYDDDRARWWAVAGALLGLGVLIRPGFLPIAAAPFAVRFLWGKRAGLLRPLVGFAVAFALVMSPWVIRNMIVLHEPAPLSTHGGDPILAGVDPYYYESGDPRYRFHGPTYEQYMASEDRADTKSGTAKKAIVAELRAKPLQTIWWYAVGKPVRMYSEGWLGERKYAGSWTDFIRGLIVALGWLGCLLALREPRLRVLAAILFIGSATLIMVSPEPRYVFSWIALLTIPAAYVLRIAWDGALAAGGAASVGSKGESGAR